MPNKSIVPTRRARSTCSAFGVSHMRLLLFLLLLIFASPALPDASYFPVRKGANDPGVSEFEADWYGKALDRMKEPRLPGLAKDPRAVVFRFTILPTWGNPISVRAEKAGPIYKLFARRLDGQGGYDPGKLVEQPEVALTESDSTTLNSLIAAVNFFNLPTEDEVRGFDGDEWILEGVADGRYHVVDRWCAADYDPGKRGLEAFLTLCRFLIDKSTLTEVPRNKGHEIFPPKSTRREG